MLPVSNLIPIANGTNPDSYRDSYLKKHVIIVAGGSGTRMQSAIPKQFLTLNGYPVVMHTINAFYNCASKPQIILALHANFHEYWKELCDNYHFEIPHTIVAGGDTRFHSVKNGLQLIDDATALVAIHDAVRPLTSAAIIDNAYNQAAEFGNAIVAVKSRDSVRRLQGEQSVSLLRDEIWLVQTPQTFQFGQLKDAYLQPYSAAFTDDASVVEQAGKKIHLAEGSYENIKITFPEDIAIAELLLKKNSHV